MCIKAIDIEHAEDMSLRVLAIMLKGQDVRRSTRAHFGRIAKELGTSEGVVRYHVRKLLRLGYIRVCGNGYAPTEKVLFLSPKSGDAERE